MEAPSIPLQLNPPLKVRWYTLANNVMEGNCSWSSGTMVRPARGDQGWWTFQGRIIPGNGLSTPFTPSEPTWLGCVSVVTHIGLLHVLFPDGEGLVAEKGFPPPSGALLPLLPPFQRFVVEHLFPEEGA